MVKDVTATDIPLGDPSWYQGLNSPFYTESHVEWQKKVRAFMIKEIDPIVGDFDRQANLENNAKCTEYITTLYRKLADAGLLQAVVGSPWPSKFTSAPAPKGYDYFHELIFYDELARMGGGISWAFTAGIGIGLTPVLNFGIPGNPGLMERVARECLSGQSIICLAITEPGAGSDVAALETTAKDCGDHFVVDGAKKWITNGIYAQYFVVAVRTGPRGSRHNGLSMLLLERSMPGLECRKLECMGAWPSGTTFITLDGVKVPKSNVIGEVGKGFKQIMYNFNHERWMLAVQATRLARTCIEESIAFARSRKTFGKYLIEHQVIQHKVAEMSRLCEATQAWIENITHQMNTMDKAEQNARLGGHIALLKVQSSKTAEYCAREALQIFGGAGYTRSGKGEKVERIYREVRGFAIPGGSEEIMLNLAVSQFGFVKRRAPDPREQTIEELKKELAALKARL